VLHRGAAQRRQDQAAAAYERLANQAEQADRAGVLDAVAELAAGAAHELNTPLAVIAGRSQMAARDATDPRLCESLDVIRQQARTSSDIVNRLMAFAKPQPPRPMLTILESWLRSRQQAWIARYDGVDIRIELGDTHVPVWADPRQMETVFDALVDNAVLAMRDGEKRLIINSTSTRSDETVVIAVRDSGCGMAPDVLRRACDPFFSFRPAGRGGGLGLSTARRLVELNRGRLRLESIPNLGTTVYVELPTRPPAGL
jgi:signal transduction histidine kinase